MKILSNGNERSELTTSVTVTSHEQHAKRVPRTNTPNKDTRQEIKEALKSDSAVNKGLTAFHVAIHGYARDMYGYMVFFTSVTCGHRCPPLLPCAPPCDIASVF